MTNQRNTISNTVRAMKVIQSAIQSEQSKKYGQQYNQDKPRSGYIVSSTYLKTKDLSKKPDV